LRGRNPIEADYRRKSKAKKNWYHIHFSRHCKVDILVRNQIVRYFRRENKRMHIWVKAVHQLTGEFGGYIVEYDSYDMMCRFHMVLCLDMDFYAEWQHSMGEPAFDWSKTRGFYFREDRPRPADKNVTYRYG
jgi:hypothetical protein